MTISKEQAAALRAPFPPEAVKWRVGRVIWNETNKERGVKGAQTGDTGKAVVLAYLNSSLVKARLDAVLGVDGWAFDWAPVTQQGADLLTAKGMLSIGGITKADLGEAGNNEKSKGAVRDSFKRAAWLYGVGDYLSDLGETKATVKYEYGAWQIIPSEYARLASLLGAAPQPQRVAVTRSPMDMLADVMDLLKSWYPQAASEGKIDGLTLIQAAELLAKGQPAKGGK